MSIKAWLPVKKHNSSPPITTVVLVPVVILVICLATFYSNGQQHTGWVANGQPASSRAVAAAAATNKTHELVVPDTSARTETLMPDVFQQVLAAERQGKGRKLIAMSLYGNNPRYTVNAVYNAMIARDQWPGWTLRIYYGPNSVPQQVLELLAAFGAEVVPATGLAPDLSMFWRFFALADRTATRVISRDADALLSARDRAAVEEWMTTDWPVHTMHDHQLHGMAVMGGLWGAVTGYVNPGILDRFRTQGTSVEVESAKYNADQGWLRDEFWPLVRNATLHHASFHCNKFGEAEWRPFPTLLTDSRGFVGNSYKGDAASSHGAARAQLCPQECRQPNADRC